MCYYFMEEVKRTFKILTDKSTRKRPLGGLGIDGRTILERILLGVSTNNRVDSPRDGNYWRVLVNAALYFRVP